MAILEPRAGNPGTDAHSIHGDAIAKLCPFQLSNLINIPPQFPQRRARYGSLYVPTQATPRRTVCRVQTKGAAEGHLQLTMLFLS